MTEITRLTAAVTTTFKLRPLNLCETGISAIISIADIPIANPDTPGAFSSSAFDRVTPLSNAFLDLIRNSLLSRDG